MKIVSWNVAGINACVKKDLISFIKKEDADIYCFQELKASEEKIPSQLKELKGFYSYHSFATKKGYSGVAVYTKIKPLAVIEKTGEDIFDNEGRVLVLEFKKFFLINVYFPHSQRTLNRLAYKLQFNSHFQKLCTDLEKKKPLVIVGDLNVAHTELDLRNPKQNVKNAGFTMQEREWFSSFLKQGYMDTFREFTNEGGHYTWWTYRNNARERNIGWRIDYSIISSTLRKNLKKSAILSKVKGSDHCPILLEID